MRKNHNVTEVLIDYNQEQDSPVVPAILFISGILYLGLICYLISIN